MHDILPEEQIYYEKIYGTVSRIADFYGFGRIETPILEETGLFLKGIGLATDVVKKEIYSFKTKGGDLLSLRPEGTAPIVRAYIEHGMQAWPQPVKLWYFGPFFRHENPQAGRFRQFWQFGFEVIGEKNPIIDAQIIQIAYVVLKELKIKDLIVKINSIGCHQCRPYYKKLLTSYFRTRESLLCRDCKKRLKENVLRILDCKNEKCKGVREKAPQMLDHLCDDCHAHFKEVLEFLDEINIPYNLDPYLVRGLDYYAKTVFEIFQEKDGDENSRQIALGGGGRYDRLVKLSGGKETPASGVALGVERIIDLIKENGLAIKKKEKGKIFLAQLGSLAKKRSLKLLEEFRRANLKVSESFSKNSLKPQLDKANRLGIKYSLILGQKEALEGSIIIRDMETGKQETVKLDKVVKIMKKRLKNNL